MFKEQMTEPYIFDEWKPNLYLLIISMFMFVCVMWIAEIKVALFVLVSLLIFGFSISFSKKKK